MPNDGPVHNPTAPQDEKKLFIALIVTTFIMVVEVVGGYISGSLALLADAGHMFTDAAALALSWLAARYGQRAPDRMRTFGYQRLKILAAYTNGILLIFISGTISVEAINRMLNPEPIDSDIMLWIAVIGFAANLFSYIILRKEYDHGDDAHNHGHDHKHEHSHNHDHPHTCDHDHKHDHAPKKKIVDLNVHSATLHVLSDMLGSVGAIGAAIIIMATGWTMADPILSLVLSVLILFHALRLVRKTTHILIEGTPDPALPQKIHDTIKNNIKGVVDVHHIHVWSLTEKQPIATMDVTVENEIDSQSALLSIRAILEEKLGLNHVTIQIEKGPCASPNC